MARMSKKREADSRQLTFFPFSPANEPPKEPLVVSLAPGQPSFLCPDPHKLFAGQDRLHDHLQACKADGVFAMRDLLFSLDWSRFPANNAAGGRPAYHPACMVGLILLGTMEGRTSLREIERFARTDARAWWLTGGFYPDHSAVGNFILKHSEELSQGFFTDLTRQVLKVAKSDMNVLAGDGTVIQAAASRYKSLKLEAAKEAAIRARAEADRHAEDAKLAQKAEQAEAAAKIAEERAKSRQQRGRAAEETQVSPTEPEAVIQPLKDKSVAPSYKGSILTNKDRMIVGCEVHPSSETAVVGPMIDQARHICGAALGAEPQVLLDAGYFSTAILLLSLAKGFDLLCPEGRTIGDEDCKKKSDKQIPKSHFRYDDKNDHYVCPAGQHLKPYDRQKASKKTPAHVKYGRGPCGTCPLRANCVRGQGSRTIKRMEGDEVKDAMRQVMEHPGARRAYAKRQGSVEPVFAELKGRQGLRRFRRRGHAKVRVEFSLHACAHNMRRFLVLSGAFRNGPNGCFGVFILLISVRSRVFHFSTSGPRDLEVAIFGMALVATGTG